LKKYSQVKIIQPKDIYDFSSLSNKYKNINNVTSFRNFLFEKNSFKVRNLCSSGEFQDLSNLKINENDNSDLFKTIIYKKF
jgi:hypothetical protein